ncbi:hypothetical protein JMUB7537_28340 [Staphylococcus aureus]
MNPVVRPLLDIGLTRLEFLRISGKGLVFLMIRRPPRSTLSSSSAASDVYKRQIFNDI